MKEVNYGLNRSQEVLITSEAGEKISVIDNIIFSNGTAEGNVIRIDPSLSKQSIQGIGSSFTESSAFILAHLDLDLRDEVMQSIFSESGANFSLMRTPIAACDFCVEGRFSYADVVDDVNLTNFAITPDIDGFDVAKNPGIKDPDFDLVPMIADAIDIKNNQTASDLKIVASAWTAPAWMKDINDWYVAGTAENDYQGTGGALRPEYESLYADYIIRYLDEYQKLSIPIWSITPVNEPLGNNGQWESMHFTSDSQNSFIKNHLGPKLQASAHCKTKILIYDHSRDQLEEWADTIYNDEESAKYVYGAAVHWYESTFKVFEDVFDRVHDKYPDYSIIHTEGCIDDLGKPAPEGILDPVSYQESGWFGNDDFWWNDNATDYAYTATWPGINAEDHPIYTPVHRYARNIIVSLNHWLEGWIDWNIVLDSNGGPNHVGNFCGAPIMIDTKTQDIYYTPVFYILSQLSRTIRPGDRVLHTRIDVDQPYQDFIFACSTKNSAGLLSVQLLNTAKHSIELALQIGAQFAIVESRANSLQTFQIQIPEMEANN